MKIKARIEVLHIASDASVYTQQECAMPYIIGVAMDRTDGKPDGRHIQTSTLDSKTDDPTVIKTKSGSYYKLGKPRASFVQWCREHNVHIPTEQEPIKWK